MDAKSSPVVPYLTVKNAAGAIDLYKQAFNATELARMPAQDGKRIMHAALKINGGSLFLSDEFPEYSESGAASAPTSERETPVAVALVFPKRDDVDETHRRAVAAGCTDTMAPHDAFWGARFAMLRDPFGHRWMLSSE